MNVEVRVELPKEYLTEDELKEIGQDFINKFNIVGKLQNKNNKYEITSENTPTYDMDLIKGDSQNKLIITGKDKNGNSLQINLLTFSDKYSSLKKTELIVNVISNELKQYDNIQKNIKDIFNNMEKDPEINTCIIGTFSGNIENNEKLKIVSNIMRKIDAKEIENYSEPDIISVSAYSPNIDNHIYTGNNKMNLNIAMRHNYTEDKTYIWIATPIISKGY
nr:YwmB family TATA-box binding protein [Anaeromonas gelatinilytica]